MGLRVQNYRCIVRKLWVRLWINHKQNNNQTWYEIRFDGLLMKKKYTLNKIHPMTCMI